MTMPKSVLASVGFDALCHCMEAYTSRIAQPFTDALSLYAIGLIAGNLVNVYSDNAGKDGWEKITLASTIGGMVINTAGVTLAHGMELAMKANLLILQSYLAVRKLRIWP